MSLLYMRFCFFFFFSSRRRHTRYIGDWSSDVCSSDLTIVALLLRHVGTRRGERVLLDGAGRLAGVVTTPATFRAMMRSEERRVGKECRSRWSPEHYKRKDRERDRRDSLVKKHEQQYNL